MQRGLILVAIAAVLIAALSYSQWRTEPARVSGFLEADEIRVGSRVGGRVQQVLVEEGQDVEQGQLLVELEPFDLRERLASSTAMRVQAEENHKRLVAGFRPEEIAQAKAKVEQLQASLDRLVHGARPQEIETAEAELRLAESRLALAESSFARAETLLRDNAVSREQYDTAKTELRVSQSQVEVNRAALNLLKEGARQEDIDEARAKLKEAQEALNLKVNGYREEEIAEAQAAVDAARSAEQAIVRQVEELQIRSPVDATVEAMDLQPGDLVFAGAPAATLITTSSLWVRAYVPESRLGLALGDRLPVTVDAHPGTTFTGRITFIARQAEFTPRNVQTPEERSKQVFRIKVTLEDSDRVLRPGMSADVWLDGEVAR